MSFISNDNEPGLWIVDELAPWKRYIVDRARNCGLNPRFLLRGYDRVLLYEQQDPLFDAIFAPRVRTNWLAAKAEINDLVKAWTVMFAARTDYEHWLVDPEHYESSSSKIRGHLQSIYVLCGHSESEADLAFDVLLTTLLRQALSKESDNIRQLEHDDDTKQEAAAYVRAGLLAAWLGRMSGKFIA